MMQEPSQFLSARSLRRPGSLFSIKSSNFCHQTQAGSASGICQLGSYKLRGGYILGSSSSSSAKAAGPSSSSSSSSSLPTSFTLSTVFIVISAMTATNSSLDGLGCSGASKPLPYLFTTWLRNRGSSPSNSCLNKMCDEHWGGLFEETSSETMKSSTNLSIIEK